jgi:hypothetical protein
LDMFLVFNVATMGYSDITFVCFQTLKNF